MSKYLIHPLPDPNTLTDLIPKYLRMWYNLPNYSRQEIILRDLFRKYPHNDNEEEVMSKVTMLNEFYSTNVGAKGKIARHISRIQHLDNLLQSGDILVVDKIKKADEVNRNFLSFASKYSSFHNPIAYPIFDSFVADVLSYYQNNYFFLGTKEHLSPEKLRTSPYEKFYDVINGFKNKYIHEPYTYKELDRFLWQLGKEYFIEYKLAVINNFVVKRSGPKDISIYKLLLKLGRSGTSAGYKNFHFDIATEKEFDSYLLVLEKCCDYISRKDGIVGEYYIEIDETETVIRIFKKIYEYAPEKKDERSYEIEEEIILAGVLSQTANKEGFNIEGESFQDVCKEIVEKNYEKLENEIKKDAEKNITTDNESDVRTSELIGDYVVKIRKNGKVSVYHPTKEFSSTIGALREVANLLGIEWSDKWNTQQAGSKIIKYATEHPDKIINQKNKTIAL